MKLALVAVMLFAACGGGEATPPDAPPVLIDAPPGDAPPPRETVTQTQLLEAGGELAEAKMVGGEPGAGDRAIITLTAAAGTFDYNIHAHPNGQTVTVHEELDKSTAVFDFIPAEQADWFLLLRSNNTAVSIEVKVDLYGAMTFDFI